MCVCIRIFHSCVLVGHFWVFLRSSVNTHPAVSKEKSLKLLKYHFPVFSSTGCCLLLWCRKAEAEVKRFFHISTLEKNNFRRNNMFLSSVIETLKLCLPQKLLHSYVQPKTFKLYDAWKKTKLNRALTCHQTRLETSHNTARGSS